MRGLRIILDKSVVYGLNNSEVDSLDRYFFQIVPHILTDEILADLTKESDSRTATRIAANTYRVSGNHGLTLNFRTRLANSLLGREIPMDGRFLASGETVVRTESGSLATIVETPLEDEILARWEGGEFTSEEKVWARRFRRGKEGLLNFKLYTDAITRAGLSFADPKTDEDLVATVDELLANRRLLPELSIILAHEFGIPAVSIKRVALRWSNEGRKAFEVFAPYAFFCLRANFLWNLGLTNPQLFKPDKNDRKDLEYCYYLPNTQVFSSRDKKHRRLVPALLRPDQSFVDGDELKQDLRRINEDWNRLSREERIALNAQRGDAPPENENSAIYQLWKKHDGKINPSTHREIVDRKLVDLSLPKEEQVPFTFRDFMQKKAKEIRNGKRLTQREREELNGIHNGKDPTTMLMFRKTVNRERLRKWYPELTDSDLEKENSNEQSEIYLDPEEYRDLLIC
ncbi:MAG TPA: hypothetical protein DC047_18105 [Blastocatellia bacterium]|nr:hypothetical protein [Blastocatellia bacterium]